MESIMLSEHELDALFQNSVRGHPIDCALVKADSKPTVATSANGKAVKAVPADPSVVPQRCGYRTGKCMNLQAVKRNGKLHKLCEFHREKANLNQKKLDRKKRMQRFAPYETSQSSQSPPNTPKTFEEGSPRSSYEALDVFAPTPISLHESPQMLPPDEAAIFFNLMDVHHLQNHYHQHPSTNMRHIYPVAHGHDIYSTVV